jgi:hypothetical protein
MKIFIICCLLFIHVNMCIFIRGFQVSIRLSGIRRFGFGDRFPPESVFGSGSGFDFGFRFWVHGDSTRSEPDPLPSLVVRSIWLDRTCLVWEIRWLMCSFHSLLVYFVCRMVWVNLLSLIFHRLIIIICMRNKLILPKFMGCIHDAPPH